jgi:hypothetical protein
MGILKKFKEKREGLAGRREAAGRLAVWQERFARARTGYGDMLSLMGKREEIYGGRKHIDPNPNVDAKGGEMDKTSNVYNIAYELVESQIDSNVPLPKVECVRPEDEKLAVTIEEMIKAQFNRMPMEALNDQDERTCPVQGGSWYLVEWDKHRKDAHDPGRYNSDAAAPQAGDTAGRGDGLAQRRLCVHKHWRKRRST